MCHVLCPVSTCICAYFYIIIALLYFGGSLRQWAITKEIKMPVTKKTNNKIFSFPVHVVILLISNSYKNSR